MSLDLRVDATRHKDQILADLRSAYRSTKMRNLCPVPRSLDCQCERRRRAIIELSLDLENGKDHLLSHYTGSEAVLRLAQSWISTCHQDHTCHADPEYQAPSQLFRPTRLIDVGDSHGMQYPRLDVKGTDYTPVKYLALSHCWGSNVHGLYQLNTETEKELLQGVETQKLSRTFQEAIMVCKKLNQRYIWIDSLCIKQDDHDDWAREAAEMHLVYANSYCTIGAVCAQAGKDGFLRSRNPRVKQACNLPTKIWLSVGGVLSQVGRFRLSLEPLFLRAWTLRERLLSPCMLKFEHDAISWECQECVLGEYEYEHEHKGPGIVSKGLIVPRGEFMNMCTKWGLGLASDLRFHERFFGTWRLLLDSYTGMDLTEPRDRPIAFQGIASQIVRVSNENASRGCGTTAHFFDGLPVQFLLPSLLWRVIGFNGRRMTENIAKSRANTSIETECYVNTLSWASIEGMVSLQYTWPLCATRHRLLSYLRPDSVAEIDTDDGDDISHVPEIPYESRATFTRYRYCTRVVSLIHVHNLLSRLTLEGPTFSFTTPSVNNSRMMSPGGYMAHWDQLRRDRGLKDSFTILNLDLKCLRFSHFGLSMHVTCITVIEWEWDENKMDENKICRDQKDMAREKPESWQPNCAAGVVLIKSRSGGEGVYWNTVEDTYTRIGYWELLPWNPYHPPYGPIRKEAKVRRVTVI